MRSMLLDNQVTLNAMTDYTSHSTSSKVDR